MIKKKRPDHKQLVEAGIFARDLLAEKKIVLPRHRSAIDNILGTKGAPILPGIPAYIPYPWAINATRRILYDLAREYELGLKKGSENTNSVQFFKFIIDGLNQEKSVVMQMINKTVVDKKYDTTLLIKRDTIEGVKKFLIDSFAVSVIVKQNDDIAGYLEWFLSWTESLLVLWPEYYRKVDGKKSIDNTPKK